MSVSLFTTRARDTNISKPGRGDNSGATVPELSPFTPYSGDLPKSHASSRPAHFGVPVYPYRSVCAAGVRLESSSWGQRTGCGDGWNVREPGLSEATLSDS